MPDDVSAERVSPDAARAFIGASFVRVGLPADDAATVAMLMTQADEQGSDGHGILRLPQYAVIGDPGKPASSPKPLRSLAEDARSSAKRFWLVLPFTFGSASDDAPLPQR